MGYTAACLQLFCTGVHKSYCPWLWVVYTGWASKGDNPMTTATPVAFEVGKSYWTRSICDYDCIIRIEVVARTAKFITAIVGGKTKRLGVKVCSYDNAERCEPWGRYSMSPIISAGKQG